LIPSRINPGRLTAQTTDTLIYPTCTAEPSGALSDALLDSHLLRDGLAAPCAVPSFLPPLEREEPMTQDKRQRSCAERIGEEYQDTFEKIRLYDAIVRNGGFRCRDCDHLWTTPDVPDENSEPDDPELQAESEPKADCPKCHALDLEEIGPDTDDLPSFVGLDPLSLDLRYSVRVQFSWDGPSDHLDLTLDTDGALLCASYHFFDWFDGAAREITGDDLQEVEAYMQHDFGLGDSLLESLKSR